MVVMPYYNKPAQAGMRRHVELVAEAVDAPIVLYNIPGRTGIELAVDTCLQILDSCPNVVAIKDATANVNHCQDLLSRAGDRVTDRGHVVTALGIDPARLAAGLEIEGVQRTPFPKEPGVPDVSAVR